MTASSGDTPDAVDSLSADDLSRWEGALERFRIACRTRGPLEVAGLRAYLHDFPGAQQPDVLANLVGEHLLLTWQGGPGPRLEDYLAEFGGEFAGLVSPAEVSADLVEREFIARHAFPWGDCPPREEYERRFPGRS